MGKVNSYFYALLNVTTKNNQYSSNALTQNPLKMRDINEKYENHRRNPKRNILRKE